MNMVKEADFVRWGNTRRVTALKKADQDALWEGVVKRKCVSRAGRLSPKEFVSPWLIAPFLLLSTDEFDRFWSVASKLVPGPPGTGSSQAGSSPPSSNVAGTSSLTDGRLPDVNSVRSIPMRLYLPEGVPVLQDLVPPLTSEGTFYAGVRPF
jgi:autophagy-related protein 5